MNSTNARPDAPIAIVRRFTRWMVCAAIVLFAVTWRLWTPQTDFPQIPFFAFGTRVPGWVDWIAFCLSIGALLVAVFRWPRIALAFFAMSTAVLILLDQHRLQPWAYQFVLMAIVLAAADDRRALFWLRVLVVGIYAHSAFSKFDADFLNTHGQQFVNAAIGVFGLSMDGFSLPVRRSLAFSLPLTELLVAAGLCFPRYRRTAVIGSVPMHLLLFLALGPWGLDHKPGVLIWNLFFIGQNVLLFWERRQRVASQMSNVERENAGISNSFGFRISSLFRISDFGFRHSVPAFVVSSAVLLPFLEPFGLFDHWPAWGLYASKPERVSVFVHVLQRDRLPADVREFTDRPTNGAWCRVDYDRWSLEMLHAPIYPQGRFRLAVALTIAERAELGEAVRVVYETPADRRTGQRTARMIDGVDALRQELARFDLNTALR